MPSARPAPSDQLDRPAVPWTHWSITIGGALLWTAGTAHLLIGGGRHPLIALGAVCAGMLSVSSGGALWMLHRSHPGAEAVSPQVVALLVDDIYTYLRRQDGDRRAGR